MKNNLNVILTSTPSDSHTWNLIFMELFLQENGCSVRNLGPCVPFQEIHETLAGSFFDLVVISSVNGHLFQDAIKIITSFSRNGFAQLPPFVAGGKMGISEKNAAFQRKKLVKLGYSDVFTESDSLVSFKRYLDRLTAIKMESLFKHAV
ncbi:MAG: methylaspartate mutase [Alphaproteobacteria bacterium]|jgi:methylaspartate mutase sigma subunit|nr:methylaspartate mutase [Alphaproteobacteria bacterium]